MAIAVTSLGNTFNTNAGNKTVTATPALNDMIIIVAANTGRTTAQAPVITDDNPDAHGVYTQVTSATKLTNVDSMWIFVRSDFIQRAVSTIFTMATASDSGGGLFVCKATGMSLTSTAAKRAVATQSNQAGSTAPAPVLPQAALTTNALIGAVFNGTSPATLTPPASGGGWVESGDVGYSVPTTGLEVAYKNSGDTSTTITWGSATTNYCAVVIELDARVSIIDGIGMNQTDMDTRLQSLNRSSAW